MPKDPARWIEAPEVKDIADRLIPKYHTHLMSWAEEIRYVFRNETQVSKGKEVWGRSYKIAALPCYLATNAPGDLNSWDDIPAPPADMFVMEIAFPVWQHLLDRQKEALVDHLLCWMTIEFDDTGLTRGIKGFDVEEFREIAERWGAWKPDLAEFAEALQLSLNVDAMPGGVRFPSGRDDE